MFQSEWVTAWGLGDMDSVKRRPSSVKQAMRLLFIYGHGEVALSVTELAERLGVAKSTIHRLAGTLCEEGLLSRDSLSGKYRLGIDLLQFGTSIRENSPLYQVGKLYLPKLAKMFAVQVQLYVDNMGHMVLLASYAPSMQLADVQGLGSRLNLNTYTAEAITLYRAPDGSCSLLVPLKKQGGTLVGVMKVVGPVTKLEDRSVDGLRQAVLGTARILVEI